MQVISEVSALIDSYLRQERTIILAIVPANQDVATVDILERAAAVDPTGARTIGVLTKPDLIDPGGEPEVRTHVKSIRYHLYCTC
jgi:interferon-induced GTP-binding protein Mx